MVTRRIDYLECPRCKGHDFYESMRQVGNIGSYGQMEGIDSDRLIGGSRAVNKKVKICRECGELPVQKSRMSTPEEDAEWEKYAPQRAAANKSALQVFGVMLLVVGAVIWFVLWAVS